MHDKLKNFQIRQTATLNNEWKLNIPQGSKCYVKQMSKPNFAKYGRQIMY